MGEDKSVEIMVRGTDDGIKGIVLRFKCIEDFEDWIAYGSEVAEVVNQ